ncbi:MAG: cell division protein SepF [Erysipelotrichaceae bacterium]|nr:cell division protein SepF [Erysipelotrichaceae bacterium]MBQ4343957.1 cell division protein SepF [Erysipelotrichaceae bacterium]
MGFMDKLKDTFTTADDEVEMELDETEAKALSDYEEPQNKGVQKISGNTKMVLFEPRSFEEAEEVGRHLKEKRAAVINLHRLPREYAQRTIDFLTGVVFALDGSIQKIGHNVILATPSSIGVHGEISVDGTGE